MMRMISRTRQPVYSTLIMAEKSAASCSLRRLAQSAEKLITRPTAGVTSRASRSSNTDSHIWVHLKSQLLINDSTERIKCRIRQVHPQHPARRHRHRRRKTCFGLPTGKLSPNLIQSMQGIVENRLSRKLCESRFARDAVVHI